MQKVKSISEEMDVQSNQSLSSLMFFYGWMPGEIPEKKIMDIPDKDVRIEVLRQFMEHEDFFSSIDDIYSLYDDLKEAGKSKNLDIDVILKEYKLYDKYITDMLIHKYEKLQKINELTKDERFEIYKELIDDEIHPREILDVLYETYGEYLFCNEYRDEFITFLKKNRIGYDRIFGMMKTDSVHFKEIIYKYISML